MTDSTPSQPNVTIIVTARDRFSLAVRALENLVAVTKPPFELIYIDAGSPTRVASELERICAENSFRYERFEHFLSPCQSRNRGHHLAQTKYVAFIENDVMASEGWLEALIKCADETGAEVVQPLLCQGVPLHTEIHQAGGNFTDDLDAFFNGPAEAHRLTDKHLNHQGKRVDEVELSRTETQVCEVHCILVRRDVFERFGDFDENMPCSKDHVDFSVTVWANGGRIMLEPSSIVTFCHPDRTHPVEPMDRKLFILRWSPAWQRKSLDHFRTKWGLESDPYFKKYEKLMTWRYRDGVVRPLVRKLPLIGHSHKVQSLATIALLPAIKAMGTRLGNQQAAQTANWDSRKV
ncbi:glycosyltransferase family 2 protein [Hyphomonas johnsonii]|uniref:Family 2 glycosyl transferase n=1 Tax=Hyphomonas johnsonii MHS-2 TaxID=1280950 RepID=A0A059FV77_9PROT|nr:glycosyltransferase family 2 protein [Hyphomonas johnsonii]KCZ94554.1 family 2 glycosyl transferase [Hyphomonas johnsonii MHS-2]